MGMKNIFLVLVTLSFLVLSVSALDNFKQFKAGEQYNFTAPCINNGTYCSPSSNCNLTIFYPNEEVFVDNQEMEYKVSYYSYSLPVTWTSGYYRYTMMCEDLGMFGTGESYIQVTPTGNNSLLGFYVLCFILSFGLVIWGVLTKDPTIGIIGTFSLTLMGLYVLFFGIDIYKNFLTQSFAVIMLGIAGYLGISIAIDFIDR